MNEQNAQARKKLYNKMPSKSSASNTVCSSASKQNVIYVIYTNLSIKGEEEEEEEEEEIYFSKQKHSVQSVVCLNTIISNKKNITLQY